MTRCPKHSLRAALCSVTDLTVETNPSQVPKLIDTAAGLQPSAVLLLRFEPSNSAHKNTLTAFSRGVKQSNKFTFISELLNIFPVMIILQMSWNTGRFSRVNRSD